MTKPQIVLVPGAWHTPFHLSPLVSALSALGYTTHTRQMPSVGNASPPSDLTADIAALRATVATAIGPGNDVVVICHSWGGMVVGSGLDGLSKAERAGQGQDGGVVRTGYVAAFLVDEGMSVSEQRGGTHPPWYDVRDPYVLVNNPCVFYNDLPPADQVAWAANLQSHSLATFAACASAASWKRIPTSYLVCDDDAAVPAQAQMGMIEGARAKGAEVQVTTIQAGHVPWLGRGEEVVRWVRGVCGEEGEVKVE